MRSASAWSFATTHMPASPNAPRFLVGKNDRQPTSPKLPARALFASSAPMACAASSITLRPKRRAICTSGPMSATCPYRCTGMIALMTPCVSLLMSLPSLVWQRRSMNDSTAAGDRLKVSGSISQNVGRAPVRAIVPAVAKNVNGLVMTSSPGADVERHQGDEQRVGSGGNADAEAALAVGGYAGFELARGRAENERLAGADLLDGRPGFPAWSGWY